MQIADASSLVVQTALIVLRVVAIFSSLRQTDGGFSLARGLLKVITQSKRTLKKTTMMIMKTTRVISWTAVGAAVLTATAAWGDAANQPVIPVKPEKTYTGTVVSVDPKEQTLSVKEWAFSKKTFNLGNNCTYSLLFTTLENNHGNATDLRPGEKVAVSYQNSHGVLIADRIEQLPVRLMGTVAMIDPTNHVLVMHRSGLDQQLDLPADCIVMLRNEKPGTLAEIHPGEHVTVVYELPGDTPTAREIEQTSKVFAGTLTAIDLGDKTVKAKALFEVKKFNVADNCVIAINGRIAGRLSDLRMNDKLVFDYDEINGVNVVNRIAPAPAEVQTNANMMTTYPTGN
jgi:hypothetical protein